MLDPGPVGAARRLRRLGAALALIATLAGTSAAAGRPGVPRATAIRPIGPGAVLLVRRLGPPAAPVTADILRIRLGEGGVRLGLLFPGALAAVQTVSEMAARSGALAAVNGDFFNIGAAGAPIGPVVLGRRLIKSPEADRMLAAGIGEDGRAHIARVWLAGSVRLAGRRWTISDLNDANLGRRAILDPGGIGLFTGAWGRAPLAGAIHGLHGVEEVVVRRRRVVWLRRARRTATVPPGAEVLLGAGRAGQALARLRPGDPVAPAVAPVTSSPVPFRFALGAKYPLVDRGRIAPGIPATGVEARTALGTADSGQTVFLVTASGARRRRADGRAGTRPGGLTLTGMARLMEGIGARTAVGLDDGGSTTMVVRRSPGRPPRVITAPADGSERAVANALGVFAGPGR